MRRSTSNPSRRKILAAAAVLAVGAALTACGEGSVTDPGAGETTEGESTSEAAGTEAGTEAASEDMTDISVGIIPILDVAPIYLGVQEGFFEEEGLNLTLEAGQGGAAIVPGVTSGSLQFGFSNTTSLLIANDAGLNLTVVANGVSTTGEEGNDFGAVVAGADSGIASAKDLAGKKVAVNTLANINTTTVNEAVRMDGGDPSSIEYIELGFPDIVPAIERGDVDAGQVVEPFRTIALDAGLVDVSSNYAVTDPNLVIAMYFTTADYAEENPKVVEAFAAAMNRSLEYAQDNPDAVREILGTYTKIEPEVKEQVILPRWTPEINRDAIQKLADLGEGDGLFEQAPDISTLLPAQ